MRQHLLIVALLLPLALLAQAPARKARPAPTGLKILSTTLDQNVTPNPLHREVTVKVQNTTDKTVVGYVLVYREFDEDGKAVGDPEGHGSGNDWAGPDSSPNNTRNYILPGQIGTIQTFGVGNPETATVEASVAGVVYEDCSSEGNAAQMLFITRQNHAREAREAAAKETGSRKAELERRAAWYEAHGPLEAK